MFVFSLDRIATIESNKNQKIQFNFRTADYFLYYAPCYHHGGVAILFGLRSSIQSQYNEFIPLVEAFQFLQFNGGLHSYWPVLACSYRSWLPRGARVHVRISAADLNTFHVTRGEVFFAA